MLQCIKPYVSNVIIQFAYLSVLIFVMKTIFIFCLKHSTVVVILLMNVEITIVCIITFINRINSMLSLSQV